MKKEIVKEKIKLKKTNRINESKNAKKEDNKNKKNEYSKRNEKNLPDSMGYLLHKNIRLN